MSQETAQIIITGLGIFSSGAVIKLIQYYFRERKAKREGYHSDGIAFRKNLIKRLRSVERKEKELNSQVLELSTINATLLTEIKNLKSYNERLLRKVEQYEQERD